jgi:hypothetical protein
MPDDRRSMRFTTDVKDIAQTASFIRGINNGNSQLVKELLELVPMKGKTIANPFKQTSTAMGKNVVNDGVPDMIGKIKGFQKNKIKKKRKNLRERLLSLVSAVFFTKRCVKKENESRSGHLYKMLISFVPVPFTTVNLKHYWKKYKVNIRK